MKGILVFALLHCISFLSAHAGLTWENVRQTVPAEVGQQEIIAVYAFANTSDESVAILEMRSNCACTKPQLSGDKVTYEPGESGELIVVFEVGDRVGKQRKNITVITDEENTKPTILTFETDIPQLVTVNPRLVFWRKGEIAEPKQVAIRLAKGVELVLSKEPIETDFFICHVQKSDKPNEYTIQITPRQTDVRAKEPLKLKATWNDEPLDLPVVWMMVR